MNRKFEGVMLLNWKNGSMRILKRVNLKNLSPWEIPVNVNIDVVVPDKTIHQATGTIELPKEKVSSMTLEALDELK